MNGLKTALLLGVLSGILLVGGELVGGTSGLEWALVISVAMNFFSYFFSERLTLAMYGAQPVTPQENANVYARVFPLVQRITHAMNIPMPRLWLIPEASPNAFATGRNPNHASVAFTEGILQLMNDRELEGVVAHELGHVLHRDILTSSIAATLASAITLIARMAFWFGPRSDGEDNRGSAVGGLLMLIVAPIAAFLIQMAISRTREFSADADSVKYTGSPDGLISGLRKLESTIQRVPMTDASPATAHLFILNPFGRGGISRLFSTHPSTQERIARLEAMRYSSVPSPRI